MFAYKFFVMCILKYLELRFGMPVRAVASIAYFLSAVSFLLCVYNCTYTVLF